MVQVEILAGVLSSASSGVSTGGRSGMTVVTAAASTLATDANPYAHAMEDSRRIHDPAMGPTNQPTRNTPPRVDRARARYR